MRTIKMRLFLIFLSMFALFVALSVVFDAAFLERYYIFMNKGLFLDTYERIKASEAVGTERFYDLLRSIDRNDGINSILADKNFVIKFSSFPQKSEQGVQKLPSELELLIGENEEEMAKGHVYSLVNKPDAEERQIVFVSLLRQDDYLVLRKSMKGISESALIAMRFHLITGFLIVAIGGVFTYRFSMGFTRPITELGKVAERISKLDFGGKVRIASDDEVGMLGKSINMISDRLSVSINELQADVERRKQLVRDISHELKTPIGLIKGYAEGLKYSVVDDASKAERYCSVIADECDRMDNLVKELISLSMLEAGAARPSYSDLGSRDLVSAVAKRFSPILEGKGIALDASDVADAVLRCDGEMMKRAVGNFVTNAIEHVQGGMAIRIRGESCDGGYRISVFNTGSHIPEEETAKIWDVFYTTDRSRTRRTGSHGLGLSISKQVALLHGGKVGLQNVEGGVDFFIEIPTDKSAD